MTKQCVLNLTSVEERGYERSQLLPVGEEGVQLAQG